MEPVRRAVIDVGTNSIKLLVAEVSGRQVRPLWEESKQTRLGQGFYHAHHLQPGPIEKTARAVAEFAATARAQNASSLRVIATSAARDAVNAADLVAAIQATAGLTTEIISGDQEADWAFQGVATDPALAAQPILLLEVGGGSTQFILGRGTHKVFCQSFPIGTVRLLERCPHGDPPAAAELAASRQWAGDFLRTQVRPVLLPHMQHAAGTASPERALALIGAGGTASILGCMEARLEVFDRVQLESTRLSRDQVRWHLDRLWREPMAVRRKVTGLPPNRADVILTGVVVFEAILDCFGFPELRISTRGLRFGALLNAG
jgi:exopolyphosphatase/guanosine-5'-triphosphate,3'-diphosphate pyrophosphatase